MKEKQREIPRKGKKRKRRNFLEKRKMELLKDKMAKKAVFPHRKRVIVGLGEGDCVAYGRND